MIRSSGILLPIFSLPSPYGIGNLGISARKFVDFLVSSGQRWWQMLPLGPTGYGDSPYQSFSSFAGNPYLIDPDELVSDELLLPDEVKKLRFSYDSDMRIDYGRLYTEWIPLLHKAAQRGLAMEDDGFAEFKAKEDWLYDYAVYTAIKKNFCDRQWTLWPEEYRLRDSSALERFSNEFASEIEQIEYIQYLFYRQFTELHRYASERNIGFFGDIPFYVAADSADVWSCQDQFQTDEDGNPSSVAGVPPDAFSEDGQLWGNPLYDWDQMAADDYSWWRARIAAAATRCDILRLDHFRAIDSYWAVPTGASTAKEGIWHRGPGMKFVECINRSFPNLRLVAEDLGIMASNVHALRKASGWPGMKVLQFAFSGGEDCRYLPRSDMDLSVCYTGTHDNETLKKWSETLCASERSFACRYLGITEDDDLSNAILKAGMFDGAEIFISRIQDWLSLDDTARINTPGTVSGNWQWRLCDGMLTSDLAERILGLTRDAERVVARNAAEFT